MIIALDNLLKHLKKHFAQIINIFLLLAVFALFKPSLVYAENESSVQPNNTEQPNNTKNSNQNYKRNTIGIAPKLIQFNKTVSKEIDKAATNIDKSISPQSQGEVEKNNTQIHFIVGGGFADNGDIKSNFRFGAQLDLPRFQKYWKLKFANQDEKRNRGQGVVTRSQRTRNTNDDIFVGVSFSRRWDRIDVEYKPQIAINKGVGLDHSIEAQTKYEIGNFSFVPSLEFFANNDEGTGSSGVVRFIYQLSRLVNLEQSNDARFVYLSSALGVNHTVGVAYTPTDKFNLALRYFRGFANDTGYRISSYGYYLDGNYVIYRNMLSLQVRPYFVYERPENFVLTRGVVANFKVSF